MLLILIVEISSSKSAFMDLGGKRMDCAVDVSCLMCVEILYVSRRRMDLDRQIMESSAMWRDGRLKLRVVT